jgi:hypothetical protein
MSNYQPSRISLTFSKRGESRAVEFFCLKAARSLSKPYDPYFWTTLVLQLSDTEPAVRHAIIARSSLYEDFAYHSREALQLRSNRFALLHYNAAIQQLKIVQDEDLILVACLLFICIEVIQRNLEQAITHSKHGFEIFQTIHATKTPTRDAVGPIIRRLRTMQFFFGRIDFQQDLGQHEAIPRHILSISEAEGLLEDLFLRVVSLNRSLDEYRYGKLLGQPAKPELLVAVRKIQYSIQQLQLAYPSIDRQVPYFDSKNVHHLNFAIRLKVCQLWASAMRLDPEDTRYDQHHDDFRSIIQHAECLSSAMNLLSDSVSEREFRFEIGLFPFLYFVAWKCRDLATRLKALQLLKHCSATKESFCDLEKVYLRARRIIEIEHSLVLNKSDQPIGSVLWTDLPRADNRVHNFIANPYDRLRAKVDGKTFVGRPEGFLMRDENGRMYLRIEFIVVRPVSELILLF